MSGNSQTRALAQIELNKRHGLRRQNYNSQLEFWRHNIFNYCVERLGVRKETLDWTLNPGYKNHIWDGTPNPIMAIFTALQEGKWVVIQSAVGTNKTFTAACIVLWFLECWKSLISTTAPKKDQLYSQIWGEISHLYKQFGKGDLLSGLLRMSDEPNSKWKAEAFVAGTKATKESEEKAQGMHNPDMLHVIEEVPGVPAPVLRALINTSTGEHNLILAQGNPNSKIDNYKEFQKLRNVVWIRISALDHPNIVCGKELIPGAQTLFGLQRLKDKYGESHPLYKSRARGLTPDSSVDSLIRADWIDAAIKRYNELCDDNGVLNMDKVAEYNQRMNTDNVRSLGVDVANSESGDEAAMAEALGYVLLSVESFPCPDSNQLGHQVHQRAINNRINQREIGIDGIGVGAGTINTMKEYGYSESEINIIAGSAPVELNDEELYLNLRSQMWWKAREDFRLGRIAMPGDMEELVADLLIPKWSTMSDKKIKIQSKQEIKKILGRSTNQGDAFIMGNWKKHSMPMASGGDIEEEETEDNSSLTSKIGL